MGETTKIGWTHSTFNAWHGCHKISPACKNCYAAAFNKRVGRSDWGADAPRRFFGDKHWAEPLKWNRDAERAGERRRVFCGSMMDVLEIHQDGDIAMMQGEARAKLWNLIEATPWLDWLLLTKRPENAELCFPDYWLRDGLPCWFGTTVENQEYADLRIPHLLKVKARVLFLSCEPLLGPISLSQWLISEPRFALATARALGEISLDERDAAIAKLHANRLGSPGDAAVSWVIAGGESGAHHREHQLEWSRSLRDQCKAAGTAFFFKQLGEHPTQEALSADNALALGSVPSRLRLVLHPRSKGESLDEIPHDLRVREFPPTLAARKAGRLPGVE